MEDVARFSFLASLEQGEVDSVKSVLSEISADFKVVDAKGSVPLDEILIVGTSAVSALTLAIGSLRRMFQRGIVIDALGDGEIIIRSDGSVPRGVMVIRSKDGRLEVRDAEGAAQTMLAVLGRGKGASAADPAPTAKPATGAGGAEAAPDGIAPAEITPAGTETGV